MDILIFKEAIMNWNRLQADCRISLQLVLVLSLLTVTFFQYLKYKKEIKNVSISYNHGKKDLELPSITFCPFGAGINKQENFSFENYMENVPNISDFFEMAFETVYLPDKRWAG